MKGKRKVVFMRTTVFLLATMFPIYAATPVLTRSYDNARNGANTTESTLTPALVATSLVKVKSLKIMKNTFEPDDPRIEAQPLYVPGLVMKKDNKPHNVVFVASMGNLVHAFDADAPEGRDLLWTSTLLSNPYTPIAKPAQNPEGRETNVDLWGINILWGILSTPVIDLDKQQMYLVNWTEGPDPNNPVLLLHRIDLTDGKEIGKGQLLKAALTDSGGKGARFSRESRPAQSESKAESRTASISASRPAQNALYRHHGRGSAWRSPRMDGGGGRRHL